MRDEKDPGTIEMPLARKRGRPAKFATGPMTPAQRAHLYRYRRKMDFRAPEEKSDASLIDDIKRCRAAVQAGDSDHQSVLDMYVEELVKRYHSSAVDLYPYR